MSCCICGKPSVCIRCCDSLFCLMDFFGSLHKSHFEKAEITNTEQFNKDIAICKQLKKELERSIADDITLINKELYKETALLSRQQPESKHYWDIHTSETSKSSKYMDMKSLPPPPSIERKETDTIPILLTKMLTRSLQYRFNYLPEEIKHTIIEFYKQNVTLYENCSTDIIIDREIRSIVMQIVSVVIRKGERGELWTTVPGSVSREVEMKEDQSKRLNDYIRKLDFNILKCDDVEIIRKILMKEVLDITEVDFSEYFSHNKNLNISDGISKDQRQEIEKVCSQCGNNTMLRLLIKGYNPVCTHDEIWVNKDSTDYLVEYECPKCGYSFRTDNPME